MAIYERTGESNEWYTPAYIFEAIGEQFDLDVACPPEGPRYTPASNWYSEGALDRNWFGFVWMNPPFGHQATKREWLSKFFSHGNGIALIPDRTSAPWYQEYAPLADLLLMISPKVKFERPDGSIGESPGGGITLLAAGARAEKALYRAQSLGFLAKPVSPSKYQPRKEIK